MARSFIRHYFSNYTPIYTIYSASLPMTKLKILEFPDKRLRKKSQSISDFDDSLRVLAKDMLETMYEAPGIGLAAPQVNIFKRLIVIDISPEKHTPQVFVNPVIEAVLGSAKIESEEGCLSVPSFYERVTRSEAIKVDYFDVEGNPHQLSADGLLAICIQHEVDHLDGKLFVDYLSKLKRDRIRTKLLKQQRTALKTSS